MRIAILILSSVFVVSACSSGNGSTDDAGIENDASSGGDDGGMPADGDPGQTQTDSEPDAGDPSPADDGGDPGGPDDAGGDPETDAGDDGDAGGDPGPNTIPVCRWSCETPADCSGGTPGPYDEDNYACEDGFCHWLGCLSDEDCQAQVGMENYVCREGIQGYVGPACFKQCLMADDCVLSLPAHDLDNYACTDGICEYLGCNNDEECRITPDFAHYKCTGQFTLVPMCMPGCLYSEDCDMGAPAYDADNYDCTDGICVYAGCNNDEECNLTDPTHDAVCRE